MTLHAATLWLRFVASFLSLPVLVGFKSGIGWRSNLAQSGGDSAVFAA